MYDYLKNVARCRREIIGAYVQKQDNIDNFYFTLLQYILLETLVKDSGRMIYVLKNIKRSIFHHKMLMKFLLVLVNLSLIIVVIVDW